MTLESKIEAILFMRGEPADIAFLSRALGTDEAEIRQALATLESSLAGRGLRLLSTDNAVILGTAPELSPLLEKMAKEELSGDLGRAALETLSIVLYQWPVAKSRVDYIRGVNSSFILRNLLIRGLVERKEHPDDKRTFLYGPTLDLLKYLGVTRVEDLPEYEAARGEIRAFEETFKEDSREAETRDGNS